MSDSIRELEQEIARQDAVIQKMREVHKPKRWTIHVPVFDEFDRPTQVINGCTCGSHSYPCPTVRALDEAGA